MIEREVRDQMIKSFQVSNFGPFNQLDLTRLGQVNLIVGRNSIGKSMLLEAIRLHIGRGDPAIIRAILSSRDEVQQSPPSGRTIRERPPVRISGLFNGWPSSLSASSLSLEADGTKSSRLTVRLARMRRERLPIFDEDETLVLADDEGYVDNLVETQEISAPIGVVVAYGDLVRRYELLDIVRQNSVYLSHPFPSPAFVNPRGLVGMDVASAWDALVLRESENRVLSCLKIVTDVERISFIDADSTYGNSRIPIARLRGINRVVPLRSLGDGVYRLFVFALALETAGGRSGIESGVLAPEFTSQPAKTLLIDEVENGIHYSALTNLWQFLFSTAKYYGAQVFVTTHSWECVQAFQSVAAKDFESEGVLIRLERTMNGIQAVEIAESDLGILTDARIEVR